MNSFKYILDKLNENSPFSIAIISLGGVIEGLQRKDILHISKCCLKIKHTGSNSEICRRYKAKKIIKALNLKEGYFDICPFGVLDFVCPIPKTPIAVGCFTYKEKTFSREKNETLKTINEKEAIEKAGKKFVEECFMGASVLQAVNIKIEGKIESGREKAYLAHALIMEHFQSNIGLDTLSKMLLCDKSVLARTYKSVFGKTIHRFLNETRLDYARRLIQKGESLSTAAHEAGFYDGAYMSKVCRKIEGISPKQWKKTSP